MADAIDLDAALAEAHIPTLMLSLVHLTGDAGHLRPEWRPVYDFWGDGQGNIADDVQAEIRAKAKAAILAHRAGSSLHTPSLADVRRMMDFIAGADIPERYAPFLMEELGLDGADARAPAAIAPKLAAAKRAMKVVIVGAGMSGLLMAYRLQQAGVAFEIIEKNADVGGTWLENQYPGCRVDTPNHMYSYSFEDNHGWPHFYSTQDVLLRYFQDFADKHALRPHISFATQVIEARFDEAETHWAVRVRDSEGVERVILADAVVSAVGQLNQPRYPDIPGRDAFKGPAFHSARWRNDVDLKDKRVAVIGTGASAFQFVPEIAPLVKDLTVFQRTPPWLGPTPNYHDPVGPGKKWLVEHVPFYDKWYRFWLFWMMTDGVLEAVKRDPHWSGPQSAVGEANAMLRKMLVEKIEEQLADRPDLVDKVIPAYPFGAKRSLRDNGVWLAALKRPNVRLVTDPIAAITETGLETQSGAHYDADVLIYGTGFKASDFVDTFDVIGRDGRSLRAHWAGDARAYLGAVVPGFPNFFMIYGPNTNIVVNGSIIFFSECSVRYIAGCLDLLAETGAAALEVQRDVHDRFNAEIDALNAQMAWGAPHVSSWYKNRFGRVSQNWPKPLVDYWSATLKPNPDEFTLITPQRAVSAA